MAQLPNYLKANRKRLCLSQGEVAFLIGTDSGTRVSRHERFTRVPSMEAALAFEVIFKRSVSELFDGTYHKIEQEVAERAKVLLKNKSVGKPNAQSNRKREALTALAAI